MSTRTRRSSGPTFVDLFAGAGLFSHAFKSEGYRLQRAIELNGDAAATCAQNHGADVVTHGDVARVRDLDPCDVLIAGPPCQGFSSLGTRRPDDPRNDLWRHITRQARTLNPQAVVIENVEPFLRTPQWKALARGLRRLDYHVQVFVLNAADFGAPQIRLRSFTLATRKPVPTIKPTRRSGCTVRDAFTGLPSKPDGKNHHYAPRPSDLALARMKVIPAGGDKRDVMKAAPHLAPPSWRRTQSEATDVWGRMEWDAPSNTLRTAIQNPSKGRYIHPAQNRVISLREAARLQTIPDNWTFCGRPYPVASQIGNAVPPVLGKVVARTIRKLLD
ncbi:MAG: DNA cytosine methyltransferase [Planctomycetota bacterium]